MKKYHRETREWVTEEEYDRRMNLRDTKLCRGKKPHDYVLVLPHGVTYTEDYNFKPEVYYEMMDEIGAFEKSRWDLLASMGIKPRYMPWNRKESRLYMCAVCKKQKYEQV